MIITVTGCVGGSPPEQQNNMSEQQQNNSNLEDVESVGETEITRVQEGDMVTYTVESLDSSTDRVEVQDANEETLYTFEGEGDTYTIEETGSIHAVVAYHNGQERLMFP
jgi:hypothetical protein